MSLAHWLLSPHRSLAVFVGLMFVLGGALTWFGWQLFQQDRSLERQRVQERLEHAADNIAAELQRTLSNLEAHLGFPDPAASALPPGVVIFHAAPREIEVYPPGRLLFYPEISSSQEEQASIFLEGENLEYRQGQPAAAVAVFRRLASSPDPKVRAGALLRLGRNLRKSGRNQEALQTYSELIELGSVPVIGLPSELVAHEARCALLELLGKQEELEGEAAFLHSALYDGRWRLTRPVWAFHVEEARRRSGGRPPNERQQSSLVLSGAADLVYKQWLVEPESKGRRVLLVETRPVLLCWTATSNRLSAVLAGPDFLASIWNKALRAQRVQGALIDAAGRVIAGLYNGKVQQSIRTAGATQQPWSIHVTSADPGAELSALAQRRRLLLLEMTVLALVLLAGSYFILRSIHRERAVANLQSEFVSAVTHEFRTPLTSLRQLSEMLSKGRVPTEELRQESYSILARESERLERLVESLLDFGRIEAGAIDYHLEDLDPSALVSEVVTDFQKCVEERGYGIELAGTGQYPSVRVDREAFRLALWNLLDNAVKYSPDCRTVRVEIARNGRRLLIHVRDSGIGIPAEEQKEIFKKFVRGSGSKAARIKGTGIGLTIAHRIMKAHHGEIWLESEPGRGSKFTVVLPLEER